MTNEITLLKALKDGATINPNFQPQNNKQAYLAYLCGLNIALPEPRTAEEVLLCKLCVDGGKYLHTMTIVTYLGKFTMTLKNNSAESLTGVYRENTNIFNGATLFIPAVDIGQDEDFYATVIGYEGGGDVGILMIDKDFPFPVIGSMPNVIDVRSGEVIDTVTTKDGGKPEQEKKVEITKNGTTEILPDDGYTLSKVTANVNVAASGENKLNQLMTKTITEVTAEDLAGATSIESSAFSKCILLAKVTIPDSVTKIGSSAFYGCQGLLNITIPNDATEIGMSAFENCRNATGAVIIPDTVTKIGSSAFRYCANITGVAVPGISLSSNVGSHIFQGCSILKDVVLKEGLSEIASYMFSDCHNLISIIIPNSVTKIGNDAFYFCSRLTSVTIGSGVTSIGTRVFHVCRSLTEIIVDESNTAYKSIDGALLTKDGKTLLYYALGRENTDFNTPDGVETIKTYAFSYAPHLETVTIGNSVKTVSSEALRYCPALTTVRIGSGITSIGSNAFSPEGLVTGPTNIYIDKPEGSISGAPWGAKNATVHWNTPLLSEEV